MATRIAPLPAFRFELRFNDLPVGGFSQCSGLEMRTEVKELAEGGLLGAVHRFTGQTRQSDIVLKRGVGDPLLWNWYADVARGVLKLRDGCIRILSEAGDAAPMVVEFSQAFPTRWSGPDLDASEGRIAIETLELAHGGLKWMSGSKA